MHEWGPLGTLILSTLPAVRRANPIKDQSLLATRILLHDFHSFSLPPAEKIAMIDSEIHSKCRFCVLP